MTNLDWHLFYALQDANEKKWKKSMGGFWS